MIVCSPGTSEGKYSQSYEKYVLYHYHELNTDFPTLMLLWENELLTLYYIMKEHASSGINFHLFVHTCS